MPFSVQRKELPGICWHILFLAFRFFVFLKASPQMLPFVVAALLQAVQKMLNKWQQCELGLQHTKAELDSLVSTGMRYTYFCTHCAILWWVWCVCTCACACGLKLQCCGLFAFALNHIPYLHRTLTYANIFLLHFCIVSLASSLACELCCLLCSGWEL